MIQIWFVHDSPMIRLWLSSKAFERFSGPPSASRVPQSSLTIQHNHQANYATTSSSIDRFIGHHSFIDRRCFWDRCSFIDHRLNRCSFLDRHLFLDRRIATPTPPLSCIAPLASTQCAPKSLRTFADMWLCPVVHFRFYRFRITFQFFVFTIAPSIFTIFIILLSPAFHHFYDLQLAWKPNWNSLHQIRLCWCF